MKDEILYWFGVRPLDYLQTKKKQDEKVLYYTPEKAPREIGAKLHTEKCTSFWLSTAFFARTIEVKPRLSYHLSQLNDSYTTTIVPQR